ncbi:hypothetical protein PILCRDRAFT_565121 [Piloderma croceum F 1598]|uniref:Uncharacterized protein n=1 Tax=Piloderma croceum (strain F 1598) TaxID=765440 RepID=A0A0C3F3J9_PILCF|nr:hypothetical protein PILCRDRAFT_565121 [Piloderma croceum F 1598]
MYSLTYLPPIAAHPALHPSEGRSHWSCMSSTPSPYTNRITHILSRKFTTDTPSPTPPNAYTCSPLYASHCTYSSRAVEVLVEEAWDEADSFYRRSGGNPTSSPLNPTTTPMIAMAGF